MKKELVSKVSKILGISSKLAEEALDVTKPNRSKIAAVQATEEIFTLLGDAEIGSMNESLLHKQWDIVSYNEARNAKNVDEARHVYEDLAREQSRGWILALIQWDRFSLKEAKRATSIGEVATALKRAPSSGDAESYAERKWDRLSGRAVRVARTVAELKKAYKEARPGSNPQRLAICKIAQILRQGK